MEPYKEFMVAIHIPEHEPFRASVYATTKWHACDKALYEYHQATKVLCQGVVREDKARALKTVSDKW
jgi:hypothetical protein